MRDAQYALWFTPVNDTSVSVVVLMSGIRNIHRPVPAGLERLGAGSEEVNDEIVAGLKRLDALEAG